MDTPKSSEEQMHSSRSHAASKRPGPSRNTISEGMLATGICRTPGTVTLEQDGDRTCPPCPTQEKQLKKGLQGSKTRLSLVQLATLIKMKRERRAMLCGDGQNLVFDVVNAGLSNTGVAGRLYERVFIV